MRNQPGPILKGGLLVALAAAPSLADVTVVLDEDGKTRTLQFTETRLRMTGDGEILLFDAEAKVLRIVDPEEQAYQEVTRADLEAMGQQVGEAMAGADDAMAEAQAALAEARAKMKEQLEGMPPEQRALVEAQMEKMGALGNPPGLAPEVEAAERKMVPLERREEIAGYSCEGYRVEQGGKAIGESWVARPEALGIKKQDLRVFHELAEFFRVLPRKAGMRFGAFDGMDPESPEFRGVPVRWVELEDGGAPSVTELRQVSRGGLGDEVFRVPEGYEKRRPMDAMRKTR